MTDLRHCRSCGLALDSSGPLGLLLACLNRTALA
jgi:hypothetical protein